MRTNGPWLSLCLVALGCGGDAADATCDLEALLPGLDQVVAEPRVDGAAEYLALRCSDRIAADFDAFTAIHADLVRIYAADTRMTIFGQEVDVATFAVHDALAIPVSFSAWDDKAEAARVLLDPRSCGARIVTALDGRVASGASALGTPFVVVDFPMRLNVPIVRDAFAAVGVELQSNTLVGDGSTVARHASEAGHDYWFSIGGGDCPSGCSSHHHFWWRVTPTEVTLLGEWGYDFANGQSFGDMPASFDAEAFACPD
jgi:hypothetical protein